MKIMIILFLFLINCRNIFAEWQHRFSTSNFNTHLQINDEIFLGRSNGLTKVNIKTNDYYHYSVVNSDLPNNNFNSFLKMNDSMMLISTKSGLCLYRNGKISVTDAICQNYPDTDSRNLYQDSKGRIWTFSSQKVHYFDNGQWKTINLADSINYNFDIWDLTITPNNVWVIYNDNSESKTTYYNKDMSDMMVCIAIVKDSRINKVFDTIDEYPRQKGDYSIYPYGNTVFWKNMYEIYRYENNEWKFAFGFNYKKHLPMPSQKIYGDDKGNIWYTVGDETDFSAFPVSYNIATGEVTPHLSYTEDSWIDKINVLDSKFVVARSASNFYLLKDTGWVRISFSSLNIEINTRIEKLLNLNGKLYLKISKGLSSEESIISVDGDSLSVFFTNDFPFSTISDVEINRNGKGIFRGTMNGTSGLYLEMDNKFERLNDHSSTFKTLDDGTVYYTQRDNYLLTWEGNNITQIDFGFSDKTRPEIINYDFYGQYIAALGQYNYHKDSLNTYLTIYDIINKTQKHFDKNNAGLPDYYFENFEIYSFPKDTIPYSIALDKNLTPWILTSESIIKFSEYESKVVSLVHNGKKVHFNIILYDQNSDELLLYGSYEKILFRINKKILKIEQLDLAKSGINGTITRIKNLMDNDIWASDDKGFLYKYTGNGRFEMFDLNINDRPNLKIPIYDFSIDYNMNLHLASDIGLLTNNSSLSNIIMQQSKKGSMMCLYPNPATEYITINLSSINPTLKHEVEGVVSIEILDLMGVKTHSTPVGTQNIVSLQQRIDVSNLAPGVYFVKIGDRVEKFIKI